MKDDPKPPARPRGARNCAPRPVRKTRRMSMTDLNAVTARRKAIAEEMAGLDAAQAAFEAELEELAITERVLVRLDHLSQPEFPADYPAGDAEAESIQQRAMGVIKSLIPARGAPDFRS